MRIGREAHVRDRIAFHAIRAGLEQYELGLELAKVREHARPYGCEHRIVRARWHWDVELGAGGGPEPRFRRTARSRVQMASVLVDVGENEVGVALETVVHAVAV